MDGSRILAVRYASQEEFRSVWQEHVSRGGVFVPTRESCELRELVRVGIELAWCGSAVLLEGEVVHIVPPELAAAGATPGVAVQILERDTPLAELLAPLEAALVDLPREPAPEDRRDSPRSSARLSALLALGDDRLLDGITRDLSRSGVLFTLDEGLPDCAELARGAKVTLFVKDPETLEDRVVPGRIARRAKDQDGCVRALGVRFGSAERLDGATARFLESLARREHARGLGALSGVSEGSCAELIERLAHSLPEGTLAFSCGHQEAHVSFRRGELVAARAGRATGLKALVRVLAWREVRWDLLTRVDAERFSAAEPEAAMQLQAVLLEALRHVDELARMAPWPPSSKLRVQESAAAALEAASKLEEAVLDLCRAGQPFARVLDVIPEPDLEIHRAIAALVEQGALVPETAA